MSRIRVLLVDDEPLARDRLRRLLEPDPDIVVVGECADGVEAIAAIREKAPDLVFLDVQMPEKGGFDVLDELGPDDLPAIVFVTAYDHHAIKAFEVSALDYLLKPFDEDRFARTLARVKAHLRGEDDEVHRRTLALVEELRHPRHRPLDRLLIRASGRLVFLRTDEIDYIEAEGNYVRVHAGAADHQLRETLSRLETQLDPDRFLRIHRSTIVNLDRVKEIQPLFHGEHRVVLRDGTELTLSRGYRDRLARFER
ncbi:MAG TPA: LytTR family transcriptional regulator DNA-binding domain-containing protein [Kofleriaceae bacterium]|jgi:two-component system LytT family response regulator|nr:LytTR family transcriptional regulator DNA-binding domain-containing protein [Kofleriaceae bacterium]